MVSTRQAPRSRYPVHRRRRDIVERGRYEGRYEVDPSRARRDRRSTARRDRRGGSPRRVSPGAENISNRSRGRAPRIPRASAKRVARTVRENSNVLGGFDKSDFEDVEW